MNQIRTLRADEIECRIGTYKEGKGLSLLLYKDARCDMAILDETFGAMNWQRHHSRDNANCTVSIWDDDKEQWIDKEDTGTESNTEAEKGLASDSFKRACVNVGIGRELYTSPFIWLTPDKFRDKNDKFSVTSIGYNDKREVNQLTIKNVSTNKVVFRYPDDGTAKNTPSSGNPPTTRNNAPHDEIRPDTNKATDKFVCQICGKELKPVTRQNGSTVSLRQWDVFTNKHYGQTLCLSCLNEHYPDWTQHADELT